MRRKYSATAYEYAILWSILFSVLAFYYSLNIKIVSDTRQYYEHFLALYAEPFPFNYEFFISLVMFLTKWLGGGFNFFVFLNYLLWLPIVFLLASRLPSRPEFAVVIIFFLTGYFFNNAAFLIRQYEATALFICYIFVPTRKWKFLILIFSIASHFHALLLLFFSSRLLGEIIFYPITRLILFITVPVVWYFKIDIGSPLINFFSSQFLVLWTGLDRKLSGMSIILDDNTFTLSPYIIIINATLVMGMLALGPPKSINSQEKSILSICLLSGVLFFLLMQNPILANRVSFVSYFLAIPALIYCASVILRGKIKSNRLLN
jgi:hypothetical protein